MWVAPDSGQPVYKATGHEREKALYVDEMRSGERDRALVVGSSRDGEHVWVDADFFDGTKGAHMSISGVSGVATKTSYALFFLRCLTSHPEILGKSCANPLVLVFYVSAKTSSSSTSPMEFLPETRPPGPLAWTRRHSVCFFWPRRSLTPRARLPPPRAHRWF